MADLIGDDGDRSRAQMILIIGFALAVVFVALAFLLNSVIFTENLATRSESARTSHAVAVTGDMNAGMAAIIDYANEHNTSSYSTLEDELVDGNRSMERLTNRQQLTSGAVVNVTYLSHNKGTWINQSYAERNFTDDDFNEDWTLVSGADGARAFRIHVTEPSKLEKMSTFSNSSDMENFTVIAEDGDSQWTIELFKDKDSLLGFGNNSYVAKIVDGNGNKDYCHTSDSGEFWINVSAGTFADGECPELQFGENVSTIEDVSFKNSDNVYGTYRLMVDNSTSVDQAPYNSTGAPPITTPAIYDATIHVEYETRTLTFETDVHVDPEEHDV